MRNSKDIQATMEQHADTVMRVCTIHLRDQADRDDAFQDTFVKYAQSEVEFNSDEHRKAWLIRVATNVCKDMLKLACRRNTSIDDVSDNVLTEESAGEKAEEILEAEELAESLQKIDEKYRTALYLKYYEGYSAGDIAQMMDIPENTVYTYLSRGKQKLKEVLEHDKGFAA